MITLPPALLWQYRARQLEGELAGERCALVFDGPVRRGI